MKKRTTQSEQSYTPIQDQYSDDLLPQMVTFRNGNRRRWTSEENRRYIAFLRQNQEMFSSKESRKKNRVFSLMSRYIGTRTTGQAKSHHQKMLLAHSEVREIILFFQLDYSRREQENAPQVYISKTQLSEQNKPENKPFTFEYLKELNDKAEWLKALYQQFQTDHGDWLFGQIQRY